MRKTYNFNISLSVLNHLGRNLYRNVITVLGEAISNSWDADARNVWITIDKNDDQMDILDDGSGMSDDDFQDKFLKIGYSKRKDGVSKSPLNRPFIGRKGIGKLALLSCANRIQILSKKENNDFVGGAIDNSNLDQAIADDLNSQEYILAPVDQNLKKKFVNLNHGTLIRFESISGGVFNTVDYIKKAIALYFRFSLYDESFSIYVNGEKIDESYLKDVAERTQFLWTINQFDEPTFSFMSNVQVKTNHISNLAIKGYVASVKKPSNLKIRGTQEKVTIDLFVNGRLREKDILRHIPTTRIVENYVYGQLHFDELDDGVSKDIFTSSREGVVSNAPKYTDFLNEFERIFKEIIKEWDDYRRKHGDDGDPEDERITPKVRKAQELFNVTLKDIGGESQVLTKKGKVETWAQELAKEAQFNIPSYTECFISENLLRKYIIETKLPLTSEATKEAEKWKKSEKKSKGAANISYRVRSVEDDIYYLDMGCLANLVDKPEDRHKDAAIGRSSVIYKPIRDAVGHTSIITEEAKSQLSVEFGNIKARLLELLETVKGK